MNYFRTAILLAGLTALFMGVGYLIGGQSGALIALVVAASMNFVAYWNADRLVLSMHGAQEVDARTAPELYQMVVELAGRAGLPMPRIYLMDNPQPNAFATGRNPQHAAVAATTGLLQMLSRDEIAGVLAHELAHIKHHDTLTMTITATIAGAISMLAQFGLFFGGGNRNNNGLGLIGTLAMVSWHRSRPCWCKWRSAARGNTAQTRRGRRSAAVRSRSRPHLPASRTRRTRLRILSPSSIRPPRTCSSSTTLSGARMDNLFATHPATENRIAALQDIASRMGQNREAVGEPRPSGPWGGAQRGPWG
jgi:heat shock protein HtpX